MGDLSTAADSRRSHKIQRDFSQNAESMGAVDQKEMKWRLDALPTATRKALNYLSRQAWLRRSSWYLAGGTALTLFVGHRKSIDLDFFTPQPSYAAGRLLSHFPSSVWTAHIVDEDKIYGTILGAKVSFIAYPFFVPRELPQFFGAVRVLAPKDIAVMKILAVSQRGRKRDFVDLYWYAHNREPLADVIRRLPDQYPSVAHDYHHILRSLTYFADAEDDVMPETYFSANWPNIKRFFRTEVPKVAKEILALK